MLATEPAFEHRLYFLKIRFYKDFCVVNHNIRYAVTWSKIKLLGGSLRHVARWHGLNYIINHYLIPNPSILQNNGRNDVCPRVGFYISCVYETYNAAVLWLLINKPQTQIVFSAKQVSFSGWSIKSFHRVFIINIPTKNHGEINGKKNLNFRFEWNWFLDKFECDTWVCGMFCADEEKN